MSASFDLTVFERHAVKHRQCVQIDNRLRGIPHSFIYASPCFRALRRLLSGVGLPMIPEYDDGHDDDATPRSPELTCVTCDSGFGVRSPMSTLGHDTMRTVDVGALFADDLAGSVLEWNDAPVGVSGYVRANLGNLPCICVLPSMTLRLLLSCVGLSTAISPRISMGIAQCSVNYRPRRCLRLHRTVHNCVC